MAEEMNYDTLRQLMIHNRSIRRFDNSKKIGTDTLRSLVDLTRYCASGRNAQPLRYRIVPDEETCKAIYPLLAWAGYYSDWEGPEPSQRPVAYLVQCLDLAVATNPLCDDGLQLEAITLGATSLGFNACIIKAFNEAKLTEVLHLSETLKPLYVVAFGYPAEKSVIVDMEKSDSFKYYRNERDEQCVPKRKLDDLLI